MNNIAYIINEYRGLSLTDTVIDCMIRDIEREVMVSCLTPIQIKEVPVPHVRHTNKQLVINENERVAAWVANLVGCDSSMWASTVSIGLEKDGELVAGIVFESYTGTNCNIHAAGVGSYWLNRTLLFTAFDFAFNKLGVKRLTALVPSDNQKAIDFDANLGFEVESVMKDGIPNGDVIVMVMYKDTCRFLRGEHDGR